MRIDAMCKMERALDGALLCSRAKGDAGCVGSPPVAFGAKLGISVSIENDERHKLVHWKAAALCGVGKDHPGSPCPTSRR
jgi:hypothetical protein